MLKMYSYLVCVQVATPEKEKGRSLRAELSQAPSILRALFHRHRCEAVSAIFGVRLILFLLHFVAKMGNPCHVVGWCSDPSRA